MELMIAVVIVGILASIAYPSYIDFVTRSNRTEAQRELVRLANLQEQLFVDSRTYTEDMTDLGMAADPYITESGFYSIDAVVVNATFTLTATAKGTQATNDSACGSLTITETGAKTPQGTCWEQ
jgi:type IV pilus assembly protein PilE